MPSTTALARNNSNAVAVTLSDRVLGLIDAYLAYLDQRVKSDQLSAASRDTYAQGIARFVDYTLFARPSGNVVMAWLAHLHEQKLKAGAINAWLSGVRGFFNWAEREHGLAPNPTLGLKGARRTNTKTKHKRDRLTDDEVLRVLDVDTSTDEGKRNLAYLAVRAYTGVRDIELHRANIGDVQTRGKRTVLYVQGKGHSEADDYVVLMPSAETALRDWIVARHRLMDKHDETALFVSLSDRSFGERLSLRAIRWLVKRAYRAAGVTETNKTSHSLRHTAISNAIDHGAPIQKAQSMARHESIETTAIYYHERDRLEHPAEEFIKYEK